MRKWRLKNRDKINARDRQRYVANPERKTSANNKYKLSHVAEVKARLRKWRLKNRSKISEYRSRRDNMDRANQLRREKYAIASTDDTKRLDWLENGSSKSIKTAWDFVDKNGRITRATIDAAMADDTKEQ
jgi:hypothetical protein